MISGPLSHNLGPGTSPVSINVGPKWLMISSPWSDDVKPLQLGVSIWVSVLLDKYLYYRPTHRLCQDFAHQGLPIAQGTLTDGLKRLVGLFEPLVALMLAKQMTEYRFHGDETGWKVFEEIVNKIGYRWYLWLFQSPSVIYYHMAPGRGANVPKEHFSRLSRHITKAIIVCDRYIAYKCLAKDNVLILLAFCWAHVRRDFLDAARSRPAFEQWMLGWVEDIAELYHLNTLRVACWEPNKSLDEQSPCFVEHHEALCKKLAEIELRRDEHLQQKGLNKIKRKLLESLKNHWEGLTVFVKYPDIPMDNNTAERSVRGPVTGRKNYYGSGSVWSAHLAAMMFTLLQTVLLWDLNPRHWLQAFLQACADNGGTCPSNLSLFLPWQMTEQRKQELSQPVPIDGVHVPETMDSS